MARKLSTFRTGLLILVIISAGVILVVLGAAITARISLEPENATSKLGPVRTETSGTASGDAFVRFEKAQVRGSASPGGTYADWYFPGVGLESIEWTEVPIADPAISLTNDGLLHYYAYTFGVLNHTNEVGYGYAGFQTNGYINGIQQKRKVVNFSFWRSNGGKTSSPGIMNSGNQESGGFQIMYPYSWSTGVRYKFQIKQGPSGVDAQGKWWGLWVTNLDSNSTTFIGEERVQTTINGLNSIQLNPRTGAFGEDLHWWRSLSGTIKYICSDFENSGMATIDVTANDGSVKPNNFSEFTNSLQPSVDPNNGYATTNCAVSNYKDSNKNIQMNLGYWSPAAPNYLNNL